VIVDGGTRLRHLAEVDTKLRRHAAKLAAAAPAPACPPHLQHGGPGHAAHDVSQHLAPVCRRSGRHVGAVPSCLAHIAAPAGSNALLRPQLRLPAGQALRMHVALQGKAGKVKGQVKWRAGEKGSAAAQGAGASAPCPYPPTRWSTHHAASAGAGCHEGPRIPVIFSLPASAAHRGRLRGRRRPPGGCRSSPARRVVGGWAAALQRPRATALPAGAIHPPGRSMGSQRD
jgi:hypothetical protein